MSVAESAFRRRNARCGLIASCLGNRLEWFDWVIYAQFATPIAANYFPSSDPAAQNEPAERAQVESGVEYRQGAERSSAGIFNTGGVAVAYHASILEAP